MHLAIGDGELHLPAENRAKLFPPLQRVDLHGHDLHVLLKVRLSVRRD